MIIYSVVFFKDGAGFGPEYKTVEIKQDIGGKLICNSVYNADLHSWQYNVDYKYIDIDGDTLDFESGFFYGQEWDKNEQIKKYDNWLILKTSYWRGSNRLIIRNIQSGTTKIFDIDSQFIEEDSLWVAKEIKSLKNYCCAETFIYGINENKISVKYKFPTDEHLTQKYGERKVTYTIDTKTGNIKMTEIN
jgi:hypothetical protein